MKLNANQERTLMYLLNYPGATTAEVGIMLNVKDAQNGLQKAASLVVVSLRRRGFIADVEDRCPTCGGARTRGRRNGPLHLTTDGINTALALSHARKEAA